VEAAGMGILGGGSLLLVGKARAAAAALRFPECGLPQSRDGHVWLPD